MIKLVILDFDDTLCPSEEATFHLINAVIEEMGLPPITRETQRKNWGKPLREGIIERVPGIDVEEFMKKFEEVLPQFIEQGKYDKIPQENLEVLDHLKKEGKKLAILTSRIFPEVKHLLHESHSLSSKVDAFFHKDNSQYHKPDPRVFDQILSQFHADPEESAYVGDTISDAIATKGAGIHFIADLESGLKTKEDFAGQNVDAFVEKFTDITNLIHQW